MGVRQVQIKNLLRERESAMIQYLGINRSDDRRTRYAYIEKTLYWWHQPSMGFSKACLEDRRMGVGREERKHSYNGKQTPDKSISQQRNEIREHLPKGQ